MASAYLARPARSRAQAADAVRKDRLDLVRRFLSAFYRARS